MSEELYLLHLEKELLLHIEGAVTADHTIPWEMLKQIGDKLQALLITIAKNSLDYPTSIDLNKVKLVFAEFYPGSAVPVWKFEAPSVNNLFHSDEKMIEAVNRDFSKLMYNVDKGNFEGIAEQYSLPIVRDEILGRVYEFTNAANGAPIEIVRKKETENPNRPQFARIYDIKRYPKATYEAMVPRQNIYKIEPPKEETAIAEILLRPNRQGKIKRIPKRIFKNANAVASFTFSEIKGEGFFYRLNTPILGIVHTEEKALLIENELLDIYAAGRNELEAQDDFFEQFHFTYQRLNSLDDSQLSENFIRSKKFYNLIVSK